MKKLCLIFFGFGLWILFCASLFGQEAQKQPQVKRFERMASNARGLNFIRHVKVGAKSKKELKEYVLKMLEDEMPPQKMLEMKKTLEAFGLIQRSAQLRKILTHFYANNIAGFYHPGTKKLYVITNKGRISGGPQGDAVIVHELIHALQDQHFDLFSLQKYVQGNSDRSAALSALVEGDATLGMFAQQMAGSEEQQKLFIKFFQITTDLSKEFMAVNRNVPTFIQDSMFFNYSQGLEFNWRLKKAGGLNKINLAFRDLPASTEQILHPEKYLSSNRDEPWTIQLPSLQKYFPQKNGWTKLSEDTMGELGIQILLREYFAYRRLKKHLGAFWKPLSSNIILRGLGRTAYKYLNANKIRESAAGWGGDRYKVYYNPKTGKTALVWLTYWDTEKDSQEFFMAMKKVRQLGGKDFPASVYQQGKKVLVLTNIPDMKEELVESLWRTAKIQTFDRSRFKKEFPICQSIYRLRFEKNKTKRKAWEKKILGYGKAAIPFLIQALDGEKKKDFLAFISQTLYKLTGKNLGANYKAWKKWQEDQKK